MLNIIRPTLLLDEIKARSNMARMSAKAARQSVFFRPHFKTHQSVEIGGWFRAAGTRAITVSSLDMADYFARDGWDDITVAFPVNLRQLEEINAIASRIKLGLQIESIETARALSNQLLHSADAWIKVDTGSHRTGIPWNDLNQLQEVAAEIAAYGRLTLRGLLTHAGQTYHGRSPAEIVEMYQQSVFCMNTARQQLMDDGFENVQVTVGDTPGCSLAEDLGRVDEIRPGNFLFYDATQYTLGACGFGDLATALVCPVVAKHSNRGEIVLYGGGVHLSKEFFEEDGVRKYGLAAEWNGERWGEPIPGAYISSLSQEHGILRVRAEDFDRFSVGGLACILPAHSCLTAQAMRSFTTLDGRVISTLNS